MQCIFNVAPILLSNIFLIKEEESCTYSCNVSGLSRPFLSSLRKGNIDIILSRKLLWLIELEVKNLDVFCDLWWFYFFIPEKTLFSSPSLGIKRLQTHREMLIPQL